MLNEIEISEEKIDEYNLYFSKLRKMAKENPDFWINEPIIKYIKFLKCLNPQQYGIRMSNKIAKDLKLKPAGIKNRGDKKIKMENILKLKVVFLLQQMKNLI